MLFSSGIELPTLVPKNIDFMNLNPLITFNKDFVQKKQMLRCSKLMKILGPTYSIILILEGGLLLPVEHATGLVIGSRIHRVGRIIR
jgi:hypothetical protein